MMHGKSGDTVNRGTVNRGITVIYLIGKYCNWVYWGNSKLHTSSVVHSQSILGSM